MKFIFLMDPLETISFDTDTTFVMMLGAHNRGHEVYFVPEDGISYTEGKVYFHATKVVPQNIAHMPFTEEHTVRLSQDEIHAVFIRTDPPVDDQYIMNTWFLDLLPKHIAVINNPSGIRTVNEKVWTSQFKSITPPTIISANKRDLLDFTAKHKNVIAKPTDGFGGLGIFHIENGHTNTKVILETLTDRYNKAIIIQKYVPDAQKGDKRILLLDGKILGAVLRIHEEGEHRNNLYAGGSAKPAVITDNDKKIVNILRPHLQKLGLYFVGIDLLGHYLTEVNVTSPTCLQEMNRLYNVKLEEKIIDFVEKLVE
ncbi:MAG: glutathione synthase [Candidatus Omnitrophica bacterium]|nr:glutathione synthase [Candidatus Omnitrophota bacterium]MDE2222440.1 glutathione synthase [Candidatus Omnitrophota bacterium]